MNEEDKKILKNAKRIFESMQAGQVILMVKDEDEQKRLALTFQRISAAFRCFKQYSDNMASLNENNPADMARAQDFVMQLTLGIMTVYPSEDLFNLDLKNLQFTVASIGGKP